MARDGLIGRGLDLLEERTGFSLIKSEQLQEFHDMSDRFGQFMDEAAELGYHAMDLLSGRPQEMRLERRRRLAQRSRIALIQDPLAGAEADLRANFAFGSGIPAPKAKADAVQEVLDEAWTDPVNAEKLTSFEALRHRSNELLTAANLYPTAFVKNGRVRLGFLDGDIVVDVVTDPEDDERPLWYVTRKRRVEWDFTADRVRTVDEIADGYPKVVYYKHWRNVEDAEREAQENGDTLEKPGDAKTEDGLVYHVRINRIGRTQFGTPPWARTLRFMSAMNVLTESHVSMAEAASSLVAKRVQKGTPGQLADAASAVLTQAGELAARSFGDDADLDHGAAERSSQRPIPPGSMWLENEADRLESMNLGSGAAQMAQTAQIVRAPISAAAGFQQGYFGDAQNAGSLASATALELPALMNVKAWQQMGKDLLGWFADLVIQEAVRAGRLGGVGAPPEEGNPLTEEPLSALNLQEADQRAELERRTGLDLSYAFEMPYPGRRDLADVTTATTAMLTAVPGGGRNDALLRIILQFAFTHGLQLQDPSAAVEDVMEEQKKVRKFLDDQAAAAAGLGPPTPGGPGSGDLPPQGGGGGSAETAPQYGENKTATPPGPMGAQEAEELIEALPDATVALLEHEFGGPLMELLGGRSENGSTAAA